MAESRKKTQWAKRRAKAWGQLIRHPLSPAPSPLLPNWRGFAREATAQKIPKRQKVLDLLQAKVTG